MDVTIKAVGYDNYLDSKVTSRGKETRLQSDSLSIATSAFRRGLTIVATETEPKGSGRRHGTPRAVDRELSLNLNVDDLRQILAKAIEAGLVEMPAISSIREAHSALGRALTELNAGEPVA